MEAAAKHCAEGIGIWQWAGNDEGGEPDVVMACCGDVPTLETLAAVSIMREHLPGLKIRIVNVVDLMKLQPQSEHPHGLGDDDFDELFTKNKPVIFAFLPSYGPAKPSSDRIVATNITKPCLFVFIFHLLPQPNCFRMITDSRPLAINLSRRTLGISPMGQGV